MSTIVNEGLLVTIINEGLSLTSVKETTNFIKTVVLKKNYMQLHRMSSYMKVKRSGGAKTSYFL